MVLRQNTKQFLERAALAHVFEAIPDSTWLPGLAISVKNKPILVITKPGITAEMIKSSMVLVIQVLIIKYRELTARHFSERIWLYFVRAEIIDTEVTQVPPENFFLLLNPQNIGAFVRDTYTGKMNGAVIIVFSQFGRTVVANTNVIGDRRTANHVFIISKALKAKGFVNNKPERSKPDQGGLIHQAILELFMLPYLTNDLKHVQKKF